MHWTLFIDESGNLGPLKHTEWPLGMRILAGLLLPLEREQAERACEELLIDGLREAKAAWWTRDVHARILTSPPQMATRCDSDTVPAPIRMASRRVKELGAKVRNEVPGSERWAWDRLLIVGSGVLEQLHRRVGELVKSHNGHVLLVSEHGPVLSPSAEGRRNPKVRLPYTPMLRALLEEAVLAASLADDAPQIASVVAFRQGHDPASIARRDWEEAVAKASDASHRRRSKRPWLGRPKWQYIAYERAETNRGLQVADIIAHALGPGTDASVQPTPEMVAKRTLDAVRARARSILRIPEDRVGDHDALDAHFVVQQAVRHFDSNTDFESCNEQAQALAGSRGTPSFGTYPSGREQARAIVNELKERRE